MLGWPMGGIRGHMLKGLGEMDHVHWRLAEEDNGRHCPLSDAPLAFLPCCPWEGNEVYLAKTHGA